MRTNSDDYNAFNQASSKDLRLVIKLAFATDLYLTSHAGIPNIPANRVDDVLRSVSSLSQRLNPDEGRSEIGALSFDVVDAGGAVTDEFRAELAAGNGLIGTTVELWRGGAGMDWTDFRLEQTQEISSEVAFDKGQYRVRCQDVQRAMRKNIFDPAKTFLAAQFDAGAATLSVFDTSEFEACSHVASFGDQPTGSHFYLKIKYSNGFEIVRATGSTATTFTGCVRGVFGTADVTHTLPSGSTGSSGVEVEEYVYLELPAPAMAYALLTGNIIGGGTIPAKWNLGVPAALVDQPSFEDIGTDWFDSSDYSSGLIFRFQDIGKSDGKRFIETEVCLLAGAFLRVGADGKLYMRRMTGVISRSDFVHEIGPHNAFRIGPSRHDLSQIRNILDVRWAWVHFSGEPAPRFVRRNVLVDATSIAIHGEQQPFELEFRGLHNERHTFTTLINRFDALRDRYAGPPIVIDVELLPSMNDLEVGDIVRAAFASVRDYAGDDTLDRSFEVQQLSIDQRSGRVRASLFGSTQKAEPIADTGAGANSELPDGWYSSEGTEMGTVLTIDGAGVLQASGTLAGGTTTRTIFYYLGDFTVASGLTLTITGNVEIRIRGQFQINGTVECTTGRASNTAGYLGTTFGGRGILKGNGPKSTFPADRVNGLNSTMPVIEIENAAGVLIGIPADMRGSGGGVGGDVLDWDGATYQLESAGGAGGAGGGSLVSVSRGAGYGAAGETLLSGEDGAAGQQLFVEAAGSGGGGAPGTLLHLLDGAQVTIPILVGNVVALYGTSPITAGLSETQGKAAAADPIDLSIAAARVAFVPASRDPYPEFSNLLLGSEPAVSVLTQESHAVAAASDGTGYSLAGALGTHRVFKGTTEVTADAAHSIVGGTDNGTNWTLTQNGLTLTLQEADGTFALSGASWTSSQEVFTLRANYAGVNFDKVYTIVKANAGPGNPPVTAIGASLGQVSIDPADAEAKYRSDADGDVYYATGDDDVTNNTSQGTWLQEGVAGDYDIGLFDVTGDAPTSGPAIETWHRNDVDREWEWLVTVLAGIGNNGAGIIKYRRRSDMQIVSQASLDWSVDVDV